MEWVPFLIDSYYWMLLLNLVMIVAIGSALFPYQKLGWKHGMKHAAVVLFLITVSIYVRVPNIVVNDSMESLAMEYKISSKTMYLEHAYRMCYDGNVHDCNIDYQLPRHQHAHPFLASLSYYVLGLSEESMIVYNMAISVLTVILLYSISYHLFRNTIVAAAGALTLSLFNTYIWWATTSEVVITNIFFILLSLFVITLAYEKNRYWHYVLAFFLVMFTTNVRSENIALMVLLFGAFYLKNGFSLSKIKMPKAGIFVIVSGAVILIMNILLVQLGSTQHGPKLTEFSLGYVMANISLIWEIIASFKILLIPAIGFIVLLFFKEGREKAAFFYVYLVVHVLMVASFWQATAHIDVRIGMGNLQRYAMPDFAIIILLGVGCIAVALARFRSIISRMTKDPLIRGSIMVGGSVLVLLYVVSLHPYLRSAIDNPPSMPYNESGMLYSEIIAELDPEGVLVGSLEILEYHQFISDIPVRYYGAKDPGKVSEEVTGYYFIEIVSTHFPEMEENRYYHSKGARPYMIRGDYYIYNVISYSLD